MAIAHVHTDTTGTSANPGATVTITLPTGLASTDVVVVAFGSDDGDALNAVTPPSGWTRISTAMDQLSGANNVHITAFWALGNVSNLGFGLAHSGSTVSMSWVCSSFSGVDNTTPIDATGTGNSGTGATSLTVNSVTIATTNAWELIVCVDWNGGTFTASSFTVKESSTTNCAVGLLYNTTPKSTGSTGTTSLADSASGTGQIIAAIPFALRPAAASLIATGNSINQAVKRAAYY